MTSVTLLRIDPATSRVGASAPGRSRTGAPVVVAVIVLAVVVCDQLLKRWAWSALSSAHINSGGNQFAGSTLSDALRSPFGGAALDVVDALLLALAATVIARRPRSAVVLVSASLLVAGWISNLLDRLGLHYWTAPGSVRGVVDYLPFAGHYWNLADLVIIAGSIGLAGALVTRGLARVIRSPSAGAALPVARSSRLPLRVRSPLLSRLRALLVVAVVITIVVLAATGAVHYTGVSAPADAVTTRGR